MKAAEAVPFDARTVGVRDFKRRAIAPFLPLHSVSRIVFTRDYFTRNDGTPESNFQRESRDIESRSRELINADTRGSRVCAAGNSAGKIAGK